MAIYMFLAGIGNLETRILIKKFQLIRSIGLIPLMASQDGPTGYRYPAAVSLAKTWQQLPGKAEYSCSERELLQKKEISCKIFFFKTDGMDGLKLVVF